MKSTIVAFFLLICPPLFAQGNLPESRQATLVENSGTDEVMVKAKGVGGKSGFFGFKEEESVKLAEMDARKCAVYFVVYGGEGLDGIVKSDDEKQKFSSIEQDFFASDNIQKFIAWEQNGFDSRVKLADADKIRVEKNFRIDRKAIVDYLVDRHIIESLQNVTEEMGLPTLMVLPDVEAGKNPLDELNSNPVSRQAASVIEAFLTSRKYDVIDPDQAAKVYEQQKAQLTLQGHEEDLSYAIALSVGSDIYVSYTLTVSSRFVGSTTVRKASASVRAFETTTARLLGTETGYSEESAAPATALAEAAITNAMNNVLSRVNSYWQDDIKNGMQYKVIFNIVGQFSDDATDDIQDAVAKALKKAANRVKENVVTNKTLDYLVWINDQDLQSPSALFREIRRDFSDNYQQAKMKEISLNRKLIIIGIE